MKYIWEPEDVKCGVFFHRDFELDENKTPTKGELQYAMSTLWKISYIQHFDKNNPDHDICKNDKGERLFCKTSMSDGLVLVIGTAEEFAAMLNASDFKRTTRAEMVAMVSSEKAYSMMRLR